MREGDIFKLGKDIFKVREIQIVRLTTEEERQPMGNEEINVIASQQQMHRPRNGDPENALNEFTTLHFQNNSRILSGHHIVNTHLNEFANVRLKK